MNLGFQEILLIALVFIILFGPDKIPQVIKAFKKAYLEFTRALNEAKEQVREVLEDEGNNRDSNKHT
ncbi:MAG: twin-arginine translocase TatA/TatE family subunit [candidate division WOR-3 bacterium]|jgi:sec-independent protein translocase protein TatA